MKNLGALSEEELEALIAHVEAEKPWSGVAYYMLYLPRRFMLSLAVGVLAYSMTDTLIQFIACMIPALLFDFTITPKSEDLKFTIRSVIQRYHDTWNDEDTVGWWKNSRPIIRSYPRCVMLILVYAMVHYAILFCDYYYAGNESLIKYLSVTVNVIYVAMFSRYGATYIISVDNFYQHIFIQIERGYSSFITSERYRLSFFIKLILQQLSIGCVPFISVYFSGGLIDNKDEIFDPILFSIVLSFLFFVWNTYFILFQRFRLSLISIKIYYYYKEDLL
jgi:hypothetical protein